MNRVGFALFGLLSIASCKKSDNSSSGGSAGSSGSVGATKVNAEGNATLNASGSTFQKAFQEVAIESFGKANSNIKINYGGGGSGKGRQDFADQVTDFGCIDAEYKEDEKRKIKGGEFIYVPTLLGAIAVVFNVEGVSSLNLSAETIAKIFQREIKKWNDPAIAVENAGVTLPDTEIVVAHRSDGSGTTQQFTAFLAAAAPAWKLKSGSTVEWPADTQAGNGNGGVAQLVKSTSGAIGYVDLPDAKAAGISFAKVKNAAGTFVEPTSASAQAAGAGVEIKPDLLFASVNAAGESSYPITAASWCMAYVKASDPSKGAAVKKYFNYLLTDGQALLAEIDYAPLPPELQKKAIEAIGKIQ